ncbi:hypothetical protein [Lacimicrobium alkaliphilum]|uniref:TM2 domain-containing protein n=1 Tax=Lacimicrobium alkaliphilum TaxID=1526571 RepID=A0ABQ1RI82_9ALTE|nr:hypothetical protein [Lacimicrobium alkaliphilum]GGD71253.1 hypothetical protein GCM10011357_27970 [Lacimicrobium alkaliphilum]
MSLEQLKLEEDDLRKEIAALSQDQKKAYYQTEEKLVKDPDTYAVLNYFFLAGLHHFYLEKYAHGLVNLVVMLFGLLFIQSFGIVLFVVIILIELPQLFRSQSIVQRYNNEVMKSTLRQVQNIA